MATTMSVVAIVWTYSFWPGVLGEMARRSPGRTIFPSPPARGPSAGTPSCTNRWTSSMETASPGQKEYVQTIATTDIVVAIGPAGTGKTYLAVAKAVEAMARKRVRRMILARPAVEAGESLGFLPGDLQAKVAPYLRPLYDALEDMMPAERVQKALEQRTIEIAPLAYMRGRTLSDGFIILDEAQNAPSLQMKMFLTRLGVNSKVGVAGDKTQTRLPRREDSGLLEIERILPGIDGIAFCYLGDSDVVRHRLVREIIRAYAEDQNG